MRLRDLKFLLQDQKCFWCGDMLLLDVRSNHPQKLTGDHVIAIALGGTTDFWNVVASCYQCNVTEKAIEEKEYYDELQSGVHSAGA